MGKTAPPRNLPAARSLRTDRPARTVPETITLERHPVTARIHARTLALALAVAAGACAPRPPAALRPVPYEPVSPALPPIPRVEAPLDIRVVHPTPNTPLPRVDSTFVYGTVGTGGAGLAINGVPVPVAPNGAFLAYLPVPESGAYSLVAARGRRRDTLTVAYRRPAAPPPAREAAPVAAEVFAVPRAGVVTGGADTLATGSDVAVGRPTPTGTYRWFLPRGARVTVLERRGEQYRVRLDGATEAWLPVEAVTLGEPEVPVDTPLPPAAVSASPSAGWVDLRFAAEGAPFLVEPEADRILLTLYGRSAPAGPAPAADSLLAGIAWSEAAPGTARAEIRLARPLWGYKAFYEPDGTLVLRVRRPPAINPADPLWGRRIVVDPGHPPAGATGPTGLTEAEANLGISLRLAEQLRARGAEVVLTRTENVPVPLGARPRLAVERDAELLVSVHNNAFPEGVNPFLKHHTSTYYFHPFSADLARALDREIVGVTRIPDLGARQSNLALVRPTWMPTTLTESLFMLIPEQEAALRNPDFLDRLAAAHVRGIEAFLRERAAGGGR